MKGFFAPKRFLRLVVLFMPERVGLVVRPMKSFPFTWRAFLILGGTFLLSYFSLILAGPKKLSSDEKNSGFVFVAAA
jgi:hypothetical protein